MKKNERIYKGKSLLEFPSSYTVIDIETTGLSPLYDQIIELSAIKVVDNVPTDSFSSLVGGVYIGSYVSELTGITNEMVADAPDLSSVFPSYIDFIGDDLLVGHNVNFDINFIYDNAMALLSKTFSNNFVDTMRISRRLHPEFRHHRLCDLCKRYGIEYTGAHRSLTDCSLTMQCFSALTADVLATCGTTRKFSKYTAPRTSPSLPAPSSVDPSHPFYGKVFVFTGTLETLSRKDAMQVVENFGGISGNGVTQKTNYLVLGNNDYCPTIKDGKSAKQKKAEQLKLSGQDIDIIPESVFLDMISDE